MKKLKKGPDVNFVPNKGKYLVKRQEVVTEVNGIYIPEAGRERPMEAEVIQSALDGGSYENGDHVLFGKYDGVEVIVDGVDYLILDEDQILGKRV